MSDQSLNAALIRFDPWSDDRETKAFAFGDQALEIRALRTSNHDSAASPVGVDRPRLIASVMACVGEQDNSARIESHLNARYSECTLVERIYSSKREAF
mmetsp:Transcript_3298/g.7937  ORF Transcript_3298/g.7937 Transcript_3298/m.7937 type:complete len:99 (+) Transcript_3298:497-793(+)